MNQNNYRLIKFLITSISVFVAGMILPGVDISNVWVAIVVAAFLALLNAFVRPILVFFTIPVTLITLGLFLIVINGVIVMMVDWLVSDDYFEIRSFGWAVLFSIVLSVISGALEALLGVRNDGRR